jgi:3-hydroxymyristoyl/3-hydroxydecanoyl-(acyl carrier protein) dehydratase
MTTRVSDCIAPDHAALAGHFPGHPVVPGVVLLNRVAAAFAAQHPEAAAIDAWPLVKFVSPLLPGEPFTIAFEQTASATVKFVVHCDARIVASGSLTPMCA